MTKSKKKCSEVWTHENTRMNPCTRYLLIGKTPMKTNQTLKRTSLTLTKQAAKKIEWQWTSKTLGSLISSRPLELTKQTKTSKILKAKANKTRRENPSSGLLKSRNKTHWTMWTMTLKERQKKTMKKTEDLKEDSKSQNQPLQLRPSLLKSEHKIQDQKTWQLRTTGHDTF